MRAACVWAPLQGDARAVTSPPRGCARAAEPQTALVAEARSIFGRNNAVISAVLAAAPGSVALAYARVARGVVVSLARALRVPAFALAGAMLFVWARGARRD